MTALRPALAAAALGALVAAGCSSPPPAVSAGAASTLQDDVFALTQAVAQHKRNTADRALAQLRTDLTAAITAGAVTADRARALRADVAAVTADLAARRAARKPLPPLTSTSTAPTGRPQPIPQPKPEPQPKPKHGHGHGHGHDGEQD